MWLNPLRVNHVVLQWHHFKTYGLLASSEAFTHDVNPGRIADEIRWKYGEGPDLERHAEAMPAHLWAWLRPKHVPAVPRDAADCEWGNPVQAGLATASHCACCFSTEHRLGLGACPERRRFVACGYCGRNGHLVAACVVLHNTCLVCMRRGHLRQVSDVYGLEKKYEKYFLFSKPGKN
jgi:hypothetical protein